MSEEQTAPIVAEGIEPVFESAASLEAAMVAKEQQAEVHNPEDIAAAMFKKRWPVIKGLVAQMSAKQIRRVFLAVAGYPFIQERPPQGKEENNLAYHFSEMVTEKVIMQLAREQQKAVQAMEKEAKLTEEPNTLPVEGEQDGK